MRQEAVITEAHKGATRRDGTGVSEACCYGLAFAQVLGDGALAVDVVAKTVQVACILQAWDIWLWNCCLPSILPCSSRAHVCPNPAAVYTTEVSIGGTSHWPKPWVL